MLAKYRCVGSDRHVSQDSCRNEHDPNILGSRFAFLVQIALGMAWGATAKALSRCGTIDRWR